MGDRPSKFRPIGWVLAAVLIGLGSPIGISSPAFAEPGEVEVRLSTNKIQMQAEGEPQRLTAVARYVGDSPSDDQVIMTFQVPLAEHGVRITEGAEGCHTEQSLMRCPMTLNGTEFRYALRIGPTPGEGPAAGEQVKGDGAVSVAWPDDPETLGSAAYQVVFSGPQEAVNEVSGTVLDQKTEKPVPDAEVTVRDGDNKKWTTTTGADGGFQVKTTSDKLLKPGTFKISVAVKGYQAYQLRIQEGAGESITGLQMFLTPAPEAKQAPAAKKESGAAEGGAGWAAWLIGISGALLAIGGGLAAYLLWKRSEADEDLDQESRPGGPGRRRAGGAEATRLFDRLTSEPYGHQAVGGAEHPTTVVDRPAGGFDHPTTVVGSRDGARFDHPTTAVGGPDGARFDHPTTSVGTRDSGGVDIPTGELLAISQRRVDPPTSYLPAAPAAGSGRHGHQPSRADVLAQIAALGDLHDAGVLSTAEFEAKKADLLSRL